MTTVHISTDELRQLIREDVRTEVRQVVREEIIQTVEPMIDRLETQGEDISRRLDAHARAAQKDYVALNDRFARAQEPRSA